MVTPVRRSSFPGIPAPLLTVLAIIWLLAACTSDDSSGAYQLKEGLLAYFLDWTDPGIVAVVFAGTVT